MKVVFQLVHAALLIIENGLQDVKLVFDILGLNDQVNLAREAEVLVEP